MKLQIAKRTAGHYTARTAAGIFTIDRTGRTWHLAGQGVTRTFRTMRAAVATLRTLRTRPLGGMMVRLTKLVARTHAAVCTMPKALTYRARSGQVAADVEAGRLIRTGDVLDRLGAGDLKDGFKSWYGRHAKKAYVAANGQPPVMVWAQHRTTGRWIHVAAYSPFDIALYIGLATYKQTKHLAQPAFFQAAYMEAA